MLRQLAGSRSWHGGYIGFPVPSAGHTGKQYNLSSAGHRNAHTIGPAVVGGVEQLVGRRRRPGGRAARCFEAAQRRGRRHRGGGRGEQDGRAAHPPGRRSARHQARDRRRTESAALALRRRRAHDADLA
eukprot:SAG31_NODE_713_length_12651_cov_180.009481_12_plen_129_part_00